MTYMRTVLSAAILAVGVLAGVSGVPASAEDMRLGDVLKNPGVSRACGASTTVKATLNFLNEQGETPDQCKVFRYIAHSGTQCRCVREILEGADKDPAAYMAELDMTDYAVSCDTSLAKEEAEPDFCQDGCDCSDTISAKSYR